MKKLPKDIILLHMCTINDSHMRYGSWDMESNKHNFFVILGHFFPSYPTNNPKNQNFEKMKKKTPTDITILHMCTKNYDHMIHGSWDKVCDGQMEGWTDGEKDGQTDKKWHIEVGAPPKNYDDLKKNAKTMK